MANNQSLLIEKFKQVKSKYIAAGKKVHANPSDLKAQAAFKRQKKQYQKYALLLKESDQKPLNNSKQASKAKSSIKTKKETYSKQWDQVYVKGKCALQHRRTKEIIYPSKGYVQKHHPQGAWDS